jgi:hypothetical protein
MEIADPIQCRTFFFDLYERQLGAAGARFVLRFELYLGNRLKYAIFFGTKNLVGIDKMKQAIWKVAPTGDFAFRGGRSEQLTLGLSTVDYRPLLSAIESFLRARPAGAWVDVGEVQNFIVEKTDYHSTQYKKNALVPIEKAGKIEIDPTSRRRSGTYPDGTRLRWKV